MYDIVIFCANMCDYGSVCFASGPGWIGLCESRAALGNYYSCPEDVLRRIHLCKI